MRLKISTFNVVICQKEAGAPTCDRRREERIYLCLRSESSRSCLTCVYIYSEEKRSSEALIESGAFCSEALTCSALLSV